MITVGSRVIYRLGLAGRSKPSARARSRERARPGQRVEDGRDARLEIRSALSGPRSRPSALLSVLLAAAAAALAARRYLKRSMAAVMRCLGARTIVRLHVQQFVALASPPVWRAASSAPQASKSSALLKPLVGIDLPCLTGSRGMGICRRFRAAAGVCHSAAGRVAQVPPCAAAP